MCNHAVKLRNGAVVGRVRVGQAGWSENRRRVHVREAMRVAWGGGHVMRYMSSIFPCDPGDRGAAADWQEVCSGLPEVR